MMFPCHVRSYTCQLTWHTGKAILKEENFPRCIQDSFLEQLYTLKQSDMQVIDYARKYKELYKVHIIESECMTIDQFKNGLRYEINEDIFMNINI